MADRTSKPHLLTLKWPLTNSSRQATMSGGQAASYLIVLTRPKAFGRSHSGAGALGFRDFSGLLAAKENRTGSRQTLLANAM